MPLYAENIVLRDRKTMEDAFFESLRLNEIPVEPKHFVAARAAFQAAFTEQGFKFDGFGQFYHNDKPLVKDAAKQVLETIVSATYSGYNSQLTAPASKLVTEDVYRCCGGVIFDLKDEKNVLDDPEESTVCCFWTVSTPRISAKLEPFSVSSYSAKVRGGNDYAAAQELMRQRRSIELQPDHRLNIIYDWSRLEELKRENEAEFSDGEGAKEPFGNNKMPKSHVGRENARRAKNYANNPYASTAVDGDMRTKECSVGR